MQEPDEKKRKSARSFLGNSKYSLIFAAANGGLAQLARALAWHARGHEFESRILHSINGRSCRIARLLRYNPRDSNEGPRKAPPSRKRNTAAEIHSALPATNPGTGTTLPLIFRSSHPHAPRSACERGLQHLRHGAPPPKRRRSQRRLPRNPSTSVEAPSPPVGTPHEFGVLRSAAAPSRGLRADAQRRWDGGMQRGRVISADKSDIEARNCVLFYIFARR